MRLFIAGIAYICAIPFFIAPYMRFFIVAFGARSEHIPEHIPEPRKLSMNMPEITKQSFTLNFKDAVTYGGLLIALAGQYFAIQHNITSSQIKNEAAMREIMMIRESDSRIAQLKEDQINLRIERLELELNSLRKHLEK